MGSVSAQRTSKWIEGAGPYSDLVISCRVRLARNVRDLPFPHLMSKEQAGELLGRLKQALSNRGARSPDHRMTLYRLRELSPLDRQVLVEKHLISPQHARNVEKGAVLLRGDEAVSVLVNEEDHLRIQCLYPALQLDEAWRLGGNVDDLLERHLDYAFRPDRGYLTACPTNVGTGLRASVMLHLPALVITNQAGRLNSSIVKLGFMVRGIFGEGTEALGNIFQFSNQITLGRSEAEIIDNLRTVTEQIVEQERSARETLLKETRGYLEDKVWRAYGILTNARLLSSAEAIQLLSEVRLGRDLGFLPGLTAAGLTELLVATRPGFLQKLADHQLSATERDLHRARLVREKLRAASGLPQGG
ncbi:MAG: protein arginine kinase [bacterium]|nr:protein arginine kinase [bacterium]